MRKYYSLSFTRFPNRRLYARNTIYKACNSVSKTEAITRSNGFTAKLSHCIFSTSRHCTNNTQKEKKTHRIHELIFFSVTFIMKKNTLS